uniref:Uncharacterized protein n=1 Tax=Arundo donax TaxID=35708 RepID=A0A0A9EAI6_ARUDO
MYWCQDQFLLCSVGIVIVVVSHNRYR